MLKKCHPRWLTLKEWREQEEELAATRGAEPSVYPPVDYFQRVARQNFEPLIAESRRISSLSRDEGRNASLSASTPTLPTFSTSPLSSAPPPTSSASTPLIHAYSAQTSVPPPSVSESFPSTSVPISIQTNAGLDNVGLWQPTLAWRDRADEEAQPDSDMT